MVANESVTLPLTDNHLSPVWDTFVFQPAICIINLPALQVWMTASASEKLPFTAEQHRADEDEVIPKEASLFLLSACQPFTSNTKALWQFPLMVAN